MSLSDIIAQRAEQKKQPKIGIPSGSMVKALLMSIDYTKKGLAAKNIIDGIGVKFCFAGYYSLDQDGKTVYNPCIDYSDLNNITFPIDFQNEDGSWQRPGLMAKPLYYSIGTLAAKKYNKPETPLEAAMLYAFEFGRTFGKNKIEIFLSCLANSGLVSFSPKDIDPASTDDSFGTDFPIMHCYRNGYMKQEQKKVIDENGKETTTTENVYHESLSCWNKELKNDELTLLDAELIPVSSVLKINDALLARQELKKLEASGGADLPF